VGSAKDRGSHPPKVENAERGAYPIKDKAGRDVTIAFEAVWVGGAGRPEHLLAFEEHQRKVVPGIVRGVASALSSSAGSPSKHRGLTDPDWPGARSANVLIATPQGRSR
jgi:hypothetical protein